VVKQFKLSFFKKKFIDWAQDVSALANPLLLLFVPLIVLGPTKSFWFLLIALLINEIIGSVIKVFFFRQRPNGQKYSNLIEKIDAGSFPSIHSSRITLSYFFLSSCTNLVTLKVIYFVAIVLVLASRIILRKHYWTDVIGGAIIGIGLYLILKFFF